MKSIDIITSHNVTIEYQLASVLDRFLAFLIDASVLFGWAMIVILLASSSVYSDTYLIFIYTLFVPVYLLYHLVSEMFFGGQSVGKKALGIKVVRLDGQLPGAGECILRWLFRFFDITATVGSFAALYASASEKGQRLGDMVARTVVIKLNPTTRYTISDILNIRDAQSHGEAKYPQVVRLTDEDMLLIKNTLERYRSNPNSVHRTLIAEITKKVRELLGITEEPQDQIAFLRSLLQEYIVLTR